MLLHPLVTRADDFGATPGSNDGILAALDGGAVCNVGIMACGPHLQDRLEELLAHPSKPCIGLHAALTSEWETFRWGPTLPATEVPSLVRPDGCFPASTKELNEQADLEDMIREVRSQLQVLRDHGVEPGYMDTHMVFTWVKGVNQRLAALCKEEGLIYANTPGFTSVRCPLSGDTWPELADLQAGIPTEGTGVWIFHPALPDTIGAFPAKVAKARQCQAERLKEGRMASLLAEAGCRPLRYDHVRTMPT